MKLWLMSYVTAEAITNLTTATPCEIGLAITDQSPSVCRDMKTAYDDMQKTAVEKYNEALRDGEGLTMGLQHLIAEKGEDGDDEVGHDYKLIDQRGGSNCVIGWARIWAVNPDWVPPLMDKDLAHRQWVYVTWIVDKHPAVCDATEAGLFYVEGLSWADLTFVKWITEPNYMYDVQDGPNQLEAYQGVALIEGTSEAFDEMVNDGRDTKFEVQPTHVDSPELTPWQHLKAALPDLTSAMEEDDEHMNTFGQIALWEHVHEFMECGPVHLNVAVAEEPDVLKDRQQYLVDGGAPCEPQDIYNRALKFAGGDGGDYLDMKLHDVVRRGNSWTATWLLPEDDVKAQKLIDLIDAAAKDCQPYSIEGLGPYDARPDEVLRIWRIAKDWGNEPIAITNQCCVGREGWTFTALVPAYREGLIRALQNIRVK